MSLERMPDVTSALVDTLLEIEVPRLTQDQITFLGLKETKFNVELLKKMEDSGHFDEAQRNRIYNFIINLNFLFRWIKLITEEGAKSTNNLKLMTAEDLDPIIVGILEIVDKEKLKQLDSKLNSKEFLTCLEKTYGLNGEMGFCFMHLCGGIAVKNAPEFDNDLQENVVAQIKKIKIAKPDLIWIDFNWKYKFNSSGTKVFNDLLSKLGTIQTKQERKETLVSLFNETGKWLQENQNKLINSNTNEIKLAKELRSKVETTLYQERPDQSNNPLQEALLGMKFYVNHKLKNTNSDGIKKMRELLVVDIEKLNVSQQSELFFKIKEIAKSRTHVSLFKHHFFHSAIIGDGRSKEVDEFYRNLTRTNLLSRLIPNRSPKSKGDPENYQMPSIKSLAIDMEIKNKPGLAPKVEAKTKIDMPNFEEFIGPANGIPNPHLIDAVIAELLKKTPDDLKAIKGLIDSGNYSELVKEAFNTVYQKVIDVHPKRNEFEHKEEPSFRRI